jgi:hypothetical protein
MHIDPKDLIPINLNDFQAGGTFYHLRSPGDYERVKFDKSDFEGPHARALIWCWLEEKKGELFLVRNRPWKPYTKL